MGSEEGAVVMGGGGRDSDLFRRRPAICLGEGGCSGGGDPDMGGVGRDAHTGADGRTGNVRFRLNLEWSILSLWLLNEGNRGGKFGRCEHCMEPVYKR